MVISAISIYFYVLLKYNACKGASVVTFPIMYLFILCVSHQTALVNWQHCSRYLFFRVYLCNLYVCMYYYVLASYMYRLLPPIPLGIKFYERVSFQEG